MSRALTSLLLTPLTYPLQTTFTSGREGGEEEKGEKNGDPDTLFFLSFLFPLFQRNRLPTSLPASTSSVKGRGKGRGGEGGKGEGETRLLLFFLFFALPFLSPRRTTVERKKKRSLNTPPLLLPLYISRLLLQFPKTLRIRLSAGSGSGAKRKKKKKGRGEGKRARRKHLPAQPRNRLLFLLALWSKSRRDCRFYSNRSNIVRGDKGGRRKKGGAPLPTLYFYLLFLFSTESISSFISPYAFRPGGKGKRRKGKKNAAGRDGRRHRLLRPGRPGVYGRREAPVPSRRRPQEVPPGGRGRGGERRKGGRRRGSPGEAFFFSFFQQCQRLRIEDRFVYETTLQRPERGEKEKEHATTSESTIKRPPCPPSPSPERRKKKKGEGGGEPANLRV